MSTRSRNELVEALREFAEDQRGVVVMPDSGQLIPADHLLAEAADLLDSLEERFVVIHAPGWPSGHKPWPQTMENAQQFVAEHGGRLRSQFVGPWKDVEEVVDDPA